MDPVKQTGSATNLGGILGVMVIVVGRERGDPYSNPERGYLHFPKS